MKAQTEISQAGMGQRLVKPLLIPWVDKIIAVVTALPFLLSLFERLTSGWLDLPRLTLAINMVVLVGAILIRRAPVRVTANPLLWLLAFVASYWGFAVAAFAQNGMPVLPAPATNGMAIGSLLVLIYARFSLGRNIGFVPAQRRIVTGGAYGFVRHPIYTGVFINYGAVALQSYTPLNVLLVLLGVTLMAVKSAVEETFLRQDPEYAEYMQTVRWRWIPGIA
jgi:protein-S-isoprenylcysteine O-methyltransferase Ste14